MDFQLHAQSDKSIVLFLSAFQALSAVELVYQINKIALVTASIWSMTKAFTLLVQF